MNDCGKANQLLVNITRNTNKRIKKPVLQHVLTQDNQDEFGYLHQNEPDVTVRTDVLKFESNKNVHLDIRK